MAGRQKPVMCPCSPESQPDPGLHQKKRGQQGEGGDPAPPLCAGEASPGILYPDVESSVQETCGHVDVDLLEHIQRATRMIQGMEYLAYKDRLRGCSAWRREGSGEI